MPVERSGSGSLSGRWRMLGAALGGLLLCALPSSHAQQSSRFVMERVTVSAVTGTASSARYSTTALIAQSPLSGAASFCNQGYINGVGFWSATGNVLVPIELQLVFDQALPDTLGLQWSGAEERFQLFRSATPQDVIDPVNLVIETPSCEFAEVKPPAPGVQFYRVLAASEP